MGEKQPHGGVERDRQYGGDGHGEVLGKGERLEEPSFLRFQGKDGHERDRDDQQRKEACRRDFLDGLDNHSVVIAFAALGFPDLQLLVRLLHHHDGCVHHGPDGNGDSSQRHDVGSHPNRLHRNEGNQNRYGYGQNRNQGAGDVPEENQNHQADDGDFFEERVLQRVNRAQDEFGAVIGGDNFHPGRQRRLDLIQFGLYAVNHAQGVFAGTHDHHSAHRVALAVQVRNPAANVGPERDLANVLHRNGYSRPRIAAHHDAPKVVK